MLSAAREDAGSAPPRRRAQLYKPLVSLPQQLRVEHPLHHRPAHVRPERAQERRGWAGKEGGGGKVGY